MLVLSRKSGESITITHKISGEEILLTVTEIAGNKARLGIQAGQQFRIMRNEVIPRIEKETSNGEG